ncbi:MAG: glutamate racemase [bacterium]|nr:glutamate racemase [bacterium]
MNRTIGVFDSGIGGMSVVNAIKKEIPNLHIIYKNDKHHLPYGDKTPEQLLSYVVPILESMVKEGAEAIVIACNSVTTTIIDQLRDEISVPLIGMEPMIKPAVNESKTKTIGVCATPTTLASSGYARLKNNYAKGVNVIEPDCSKWSQMIEDNKIDREHIKNTVHEMLDYGADVIVLGCTHYHWIEDDINELVDGQAMVLQPETPVVNQLKRVLEQLS